LRPTRLKEISDRRFNVPKENNDLPTVTDIGLSREEEIGSRLTCNAGSDYERDRRHCPKGTGGPYRAIEIEVVMRTTTKLYATRIQVFEGVKGPRTGRSNG
jgi:hypothetical protein